MNPHPFSFHFVISIFHFLPFLLPFFRPSWRSSFCPSFYHSLYPSLVLYFLLLCLLLSLFVLMPTFASVLVILFGCAFRPCVCLLVSVLGFILSATMSVALVVCSYDHLCFRHCLPVCVHPRVCLLVSVFSCPPPRVTLPVCAVLPRVHLILSVSSCASLHVRSHVSVHNRVFPLGASSDGQRDASNSARGRSLRKARSGPRHF